MKPSFQALALCLIASACTVTLPLSSTPNQSSSQTPYGPKGSLGHIAGSTKDAAHNYLWSIWAPLLVNFIGTVTQACALTTSNPHAMRALYTTTFATNALNGTALMTAALTKTPNQSKFGLPTRSTSIIGRLLFLTAGALEVAQLPANAKMIKNAGKLARLYKRKPFMKRHLKKIRNSRIVNAAVTIGTQLVSAAVIGLIIHQINPANTEDATALALGLSLLVSHLITSGLINRKSEHHGIEHELIAHAKNLAKREKIPFFNPPAHATSSEGGPSTLLIKPNEVLFSENDAANDEFEELEEDDPNSLN